MLRETCNRNVEVISVVATDMLDEVNSMDEATFYCFPFVFARWWVASKSEDISTPMLFCFLWI